MEGGNKDSDWTKKSPMFKNDDGDAGSATTDNRDNRDISSPNEQSDVVLGFDCCTSPVEG